MKTDSQRSKVYAAERAAFGSGLYREDWTLEECWIEAQRVLNRKVLQRHYPEARVLASQAKKPTDVTSLYYPNVLYTGKKTKSVVGDGQDRLALRVSSNSGARGGQGAISLPKWARNRYVVAHEVAHCIAPDQSKHNWEFCAIYLELVKYFCGKADAERLQAEFKAHKVKFRAPRKRTPLTEEQKAAARERLAKARAVKAENQRQRALAEAQEKPDAPRNPFEELVAASYRR